jgi:hypothetical protein
MEISWNTVQRTVLNTVQCSIPYSAQYRIVLNTVQCSILYSAQYRTVLNTVQCSIPYSAQYCTVLNTVQCCTVLNTVQCSILYSAQYRTVLNTVQCSIPYSVQFLRSSILMVSHFWKIRRINSWVCPTPMFSCYLPNSTPFLHSTHFVLQLSPSETWKLSSSKILHYTERAHLSKQDSTAHTSTSAFTLAPLAPALTPALTPAPPAPPAFTPPLTLLNQLQKNWDSKYPQCTR